MIFAKLQQFRQDVYGCLGKAKDAVFELMDAVLTSPSVNSFVSLSQSPLFRRQWPSIYAALQDSRPPRKKLMKRFVTEIPTEEQPLLAGDHTAWPRPEAATLKERTLEHHHNGGFGGKPVTLGQGFSTLAWIPEASGSWALPLRHERITSFETPSSKAAFQLKQVTRHLDVRPLALYDREYGNAKFVQQTADIEADVLVRLASNRCVWGAPPPYSGRGRPRKHGHKFKLNAPDTWPDPTETLMVDDAQLGQVKVSRWSAFHFRQASQREMEVLRVEVIKPIGRKRKFKPLWLGWLGQTMPPLADLWWKYLRRFGVDHWYRFAKQRLHWTLPQIGDTLAAERWSDLMPVLSWQLWLAREECLDHPLPWQKPQETLSPGRVAQSFAAIIAAIGTPAQEPKSRGKSPGWPKGQPRSARTRYPTVKKRASKRKKSEKTAKPSSQAAA